MFSAPSKPQNLVANGDSPTGVHLTWKPPVTGKVKGYKLWAQAVGGVEVYYGTVPATRFWYEFTGLRPNTAYVVKVAAYGTWGTSDKATAPATTKPLPNPPITSVTLAVEPSSGVAPLSATLSVTIVGGVAPFDTVYSIDDGPSQPLQTAVSLDVPGAHTLTVFVIDAVGQTGTASAEVTVTAPPITGVTVAANPTSGVVPFDVSVGVEIVGGTAPFAFTVNGAEVSFPLTLTIVEPGDWPIDVSVVDVFAQSGTGSATVHGDAPASSLPVLAASPSEADAGDPIDPAFTNRRAMIYVMGNGTRPRDGKPPWYDPTPAIVRVGVNDRDPATGKKRDWWDGTDYTRFESTVRAFLRTLTPDCLLTPNHEPKGELMVSAADPSQLIPVTAQAWVNATSWVFDLADEECPGIRKGICFYLVPGQDPEKALASWVDLMPTDRYTHICIDLYMIGTTYYEPNDLIAPSVAFAKKRGKRLGWTETGALGSFNGSTFDTRFYPSLATVPLDPIVDVVGLWLQKGEDGTYRRDRNPEAGPLLDQLGASSLFGTTFRP